MVKILYASDHMIRLCRGYCSVASIVACNLGLRLYSSRKYEICVTGCAALDYSEYGFNIKHDVPMLGECPSAKGYLVV